MLQALNTNGSGAPIKATDTKHRQLSWFAERVARGQKEPFVEICTITPEIAERILESNDGNRNVSERLIQTISRDIEHGFWKLNGETIIISRDGHLNDGQHRLLSVIRTGQPIQTAVMFGADRDSRLTIDMGKQRTAGNFLGMNGIVNANIKASAAMVYACYLNGFYRRNSGRGSGTIITKQDVLKTYNKNKKKFDAACELLANEKFTKIAGHSPLICSYVILEPINQSEAAVFFTRMMDGARLEHGSPILFLRNALMDKTRRLEAHEKLELILRYWNAFREGKVLRKSISINGHYPKVSR